MRVHDSTTILVLIIKHFPEKEKEKVIPKSTATSQKSGYSDFC